MSTAVAMYPPSNLAPSPTVTSEQLELVKRTVANGATPAELQLYLYDCQRHGVHPLDKLLHFTKRGGRYTPITSIDLMRMRAHETGDCIGISDPVFSGEPGKADFTATCTVTRLVQGQTAPFTATARWNEYYPGDQGGHMWKKMPHTMLGKCAEALALRKGFPKQLAGLYAREEMDQAERAPAPVVTEATKRIDLPAGTVQILRVDPQRRANVEWAEVTFVTAEGEQQTLPTEATPTGGSAALFEQLAQEACPVVLTTKVTPRSKKTVIDQVHRYQAPDPARAAENAIDAELAKDEANEAF